MSDAVAAPLPTIVEETPTPPTVQEVGPPSRRSGWLTQMFGCAAPRAVAPKAAIPMAKGMSAEAQDAANRFGI